jgi:hypothetical protein
MDVTFEHPFAEPRDATRGGRLGRSLLIGAIFGSLAVWGATTAIAVRPTGGFVHDPVSLATRGGTMFSVPPLAPGQSVTRYATVATTGPASSLRLYGEVSGTGLARFLTVRVTRGTGGAHTFVPAGGVAAQSLVFRGRMSAFPRSWAGGLDVGGARASSPDVQTLRFQISLANDRRAQGLSAGIDFRWEARQR